MYKQTKLIKLVELEWVYKNKFISMTHSSFIRSLLSYLLITSFLLTPVSTVLAVVEGSGGSGVSDTPSSPTTPSRPSVPGTNNGGFAASESLNDDSDSDEETEEEKDKRLADETKAEIDSAVAAAGLDLNVGAVYGSSVSGSEVTLNGINISKEQALMAIESISEAYKVGGAGFLDINRTLELYANGVADIQVAGKQSGFIGEPIDVAKAEADYIISMAGVVGARMVGGFINAVAIQAPDLSTALNKLSRNTAQTNVIGVPADTATFDTFGNVVVKQNPYQEYTEQQTNHAGKNRLTNTSFTYDPATGNFIGAQNGAIVKPSSVPNFERIIELSTKSPGTVVSVDFKSGTGIIAAQDLFTGRVLNYDSETGEALNSNVIIDESIGDILFSPTPLTEGVEDSWGLGVQANKLVNLSPMQKVALGERVSSDDINLVAEIFAQVAAGENAPLVEKVGRGQTLTTTEMAELYGILGVMVNRAASEGNTILSYVDTNNFSSWNNGNQERLAELIRDNPDYDHERVEQMYLDLLNGTVATRTFSDDTLSDITPSPFATHFYSGSPSDISWRNSIVPGSAREIGGHTFVNLNLKNTSTQQYQVSTKGLPRNITVLNTISNPIGELGEIIDYEDIFAGNILKEQEMLGILGPVYDYRGKTRVIDIPEQIDESSPALIPPTNIPNVENRVVLQNSSATRDMDITEKLEAQLNYAAQRNDLTVVVYSGGQMPLQEAIRLGAKKDSEGVWRLPNGEGVRVGSTRHDHGDSADIYLVNNKTGQKLDMRVSADRELMEEFLIDAVAAGANGIGAAVDYMGPNHLHVGGGSVSAWGAGGKSANAPSWVRNALNEGLEERENFDPSELPAVGDNHDHSDDSSPSTPTGIVGNGISFVRDIIGDAAANFVEETPIIKDAVDSVTTSIEQMNKMPFFNTILGLVNIFGTPSGKVPSSNDSILEGGSNNNGNNVFVCPPLSQITPEYLATISDRDTYERLIDCLEVGNQNSGAAIIPFLNIDWFNSLAKIFQRDKVSSENQSAVAEREVTIIPVTIEINEQTNSIDLSRDDIVDILESKATYYTTYIDEFAEVVSILEETPIVFDRDGFVTFSNGLYSPAVINGVPIETIEEYEYVYLVRYVDESGNVTEVSDDTSSLPENMFTNLIGKVFQNRSPFNMDQVREITYRLVNPDQNIPGDEYYDYVVTLTGGQQRGVLVPEYSSVQLMRERFATVGYQGDVLALVSQANENPNPPKESWLKQLISTVKNTIDQFTNTPEMSEGNSGYADLPVLDNNPTTNDITSVFIYPSATVYCPSGTPGYMYTAVIKDKTDSNFAYAITDGRCGQGSPEELVVETARHLAERHMIEGVTADNIINKTSFNVDTVIFTPSITRVSVNKTPVITIPEPETPDIEPTTPTTTPDQLPNLTNEVVFEVKAVGSDGAILSDWMDTEEITISAGVQLHFRWNGSSYQQCLAFLNDNGNYSLTRSNRAMITGNTEEEQYNVTERSGIYRIECGGQRNNEFGVDAREIEVMVQ